MNLPIDDNNAQLERHSRNQFRSLWDVRRFIVRDEHQEDRGIDYTIELKKGNGATNFKLNIQLKATDSSKFNRDKSISFPGIKTRNINYLMNPGLPAFYVLYHRPSDKFYFQSTSDFANRLNLKNEKWQDQDEHTIRFSKILDSDGIEEIYQATEKFYNFVRDVSKTLAINTSTVTESKTITIDSTLNITDDNKIKQLIESGGLSLINSARWSDVLALHKKASGNIATSAKYNLVLALANYYSSHIFEALSFAKKAKTLMHELPEDLRNHLLFLDATLRVSIGYISQPEYDIVLAELHNSVSAGFYVQIEKAKEEFVKQGDPDFRKKLETYHSKLHGIINHSEADDATKFNAQCELFLSVGSYNNILYIQDVSQLNAFEQMFGPNIPLRETYFNQFVERNSQWYDDYEKLKINARNKGFGFIYYNAQTNMAKVEFELIVFTDYIYLTLKPPGTKSPDNPQKNERARALMQKNSEAINYYREINHVENLIVTLSTQYEIQLYLNEHVEAASTLSNLETLVDSYELKEMKKNLNALKNGGTTQEKFIRWITEQNKEADQMKEDHRRMVEDIKRMDADELHVKKDFHNKLGIHLFPLGYFAFPKESLDIVFDIINVAPDARKIFLGVLDSQAMPTANIYHQVISEEGYADGELLTVNISSWRNIHRIRKAFYENRFYRLKV